MYVLDCTCRGRGEGLHHDVRQVRHLARGRCIHMHMYVYVCMCMYMYVYVCVYIYIYMCVHVNAHIYIYIYTGSLSLSLPSAINFLLISDGSTVLEFHNFIEVSFVVITVIEQFAIPLSLYVCVYI